jgi:hypothetical protein
MFHGRKYEVFFIKSNICFNFLKAGSLNHLKTEDKEGEGVSVARGEGK